MESNQDYQPKPFYLVNQLGDDQYQFIEEHIYCEAMKEIPIEEKMNMSMTPEMYKAFIKTIDNNNIA